jgi:hypothetical protein
LVTAITVGVVAAVMAPPATAGTTVSDPDSNNVVTITVPVDCAGCKDWRAPDGGDLAMYWEKTAEKTWNDDGFDKYSYCNKYKFRLDIKIKNRPAAFPGSPGRHRILAGAPGSGLAQTGWDGVFEETPGGLPGQRTPDGTRYYENDGDGAMPADATPTVIVHEFGHVMGLGDDRDDNGNVVSGRDRTIMTGGSTNSDGTRNTPNSKLRIDKQLVDRIGQQLASLGKITCGQAWKGTLNGTGENRGVATCPDPSSHNGTFTMTVRPDGKATLTGHIVNTGVCAAGRTEGDFTMEGKKTRSQIALVGAPNFPFPVDLRIRGDRASGSVTANPGGDGVYFVTLHFTADCQNCDEEVS